MDFKEKGWEGKKERKQGGKKGAREKAWAPEWYHRAVWIHHGRFRLTETI